MRFIICVLMLFFSINNSWAGPQSDSFSPDKTWLRKELKKMGFRKSFINESLENYQEDTFETVMKLNLLGFLQPPQHMDRVTPQSVRETALFVKDNQRTFDQAERKYKVPPNVISALLWIETRHGDDRGRFHIVSVYLHLLQTQRSQNKAYLTQLALEKNQDGQQYTAKELKKIMKERFKKRSDWAKEQLMALAMLHKEKKLNLKTLKGSFAGAFGLPQFIPSSYREFARAAKSKSSPDLTVPADAIMSVANYLSKHGWSNKKSEAKIAALMKYNNSRDYADSILEISKRAGLESQSASRQDLSSSADASSP